MTLPFGLLCSDLAVSSVLEVFYAFRFKRLVDSDCFGCRVVVGVLVKTHAGSDFSSTMDEPGFGCGSLTTRPALGIDWFSLGIHKPRGVSFSRRAVFVPCWFPVTLWKGAFTQRAVRFRSGG